MKKLLISTILILSVFGNIVAQTTNLDTIKSDFKISEIARTLYDQKQLGTLKIKGKTKFEIKKSAKQITLPTGESPIVLIRLPEFINPYNLKIKSKVYGFGIKWHAFLPSVAFLDSEFQYTGELSDTTFSIKSSFTEAPFLGSEIFMDNKRKDNRYLLIYSRSKNEELGAYRQRVYGLLLVNYWDHPIESSLVGKIELEVKRE